MAVEMRLIIDLINGALSSTPEEISSACSRRCRVVRAEAWDGRPAQVGQSSRNWIHSLVMDVVVKSNAKGLVESL